MAFVIEDGNGGEVTVEEPERPSFSDSLAGGVEFTFAHLVYKVLEFAGSAMGAFLSGAMIHFLDGLEPGLVQYARPLIDLLLDQDELDPQLRLFFDGLREPTHAAAAGILAGLAGSGAAAATGGLISTVMAKTVQSLNKVIRPTLSNMTQLMAMYRFGTMLKGQVEESLERQGFQNLEIENYFEISRARLGPAEVLAAWQIGELDIVPAREKIAEFGYTPEEVNLLFRLVPQYPSPALIMLAVFRETITEDEALVMLHALGYYADSLKVLMETARPFPGPGDLVRFGVREAWRDDVAEQWDYDEDAPPQLAEYMTKHGYDPDWAKRYWRAHWALPSIGQGFEMMHRTIIKEDELQDLLKISDLPKFWREALTKMSFRTLTRVDIRRMHAMGVLTDNEVRDSYRDFGYSPENAQRMLDFTIKYNNNDPDSPKARTLELSRSVIIQAFQRGLIDPAEAQTRLLNAGYDNEDTTLILSLAEWEGEIERTPNYFNEHHRDVKTIIERAYSRRLISEPEARSGLVSIGFTEAEAQLLLLTIDLYYSFERLEAKQRIIGDAYVRRAITRVETVSRLGVLGIPGAMQDQLLDEWDTERTVRDRRLTEAQYRRAVNQNVIPVESYAENLRGLGYAEQDIEILVRTHFPT